MALLKYKLSNFILFFTVLGLFLAISLSAEPYKHLYVRADAKWHKADSEELQTTHTKPIVFILHGLDTPDFKDHFSVKAGKRSLGMVQALTDNINNSGLYAESFAFNYDFTKDISTLGRNFALYLAQVPKGQEVHIIAYSMGGLVARWALEQTRIPTENITHLLTLGTPHFGLPASNKVKIAIEMAPLIQLFKPEMAAIGNYANSLSKFFSDSWAVRTLKTNEKEVSTLYHIFQGHLEAPDVRIFPGSSLIMPFLYSDYNTKKSDGIVPVIMHDDIAQISNQGNIVFSNTYTGVSHACLTRDNFVLGVLIPHIDNNIID